VGGQGVVYEQDLDSNEHPTSAAWFADNSTVSIVSNLSLYKNHLFAVGADGRVYEQDLGSNGHADTGWTPTSPSGTIVSHSVSVGGSSGTNSGLSFLGSLAVEPQASSLYQPAAGSLFNPNTNSPSYLDVQQGDLGDCWLLASLAEVAARDPQDIVNMFQLQRTGTVDGAKVSFYSVRLYDAHSVAHYFTVDTELPAGGNFYDHPVGGAGAINGSPTPVLWVALAEKAYVEANGAGIVGSNGHGMDFYDVLGGLSASPALAAITGKPAADSSPVNPTTVANAWKSGQLIVLGTGSPASSFILGAHEYAVVGYNPSSSMPFEVFNPWGTTSTRYAPGNPNIYGLFYANGAFLSQNFSSQSIGSGAAPARDTEIPNDLVIQPAEQSQSNGSGSQKGHVSVISTTISRDPTTLHFSGLRRTASGGLLPIGPIDLSGSPRPPGLVQQQHHQPHHRGSWSRPGQRDLVDRHPLNKMGALIIKSRTAYSGPKPGGDRRGDSN